MPLVSKAFGDIITFTRASTATYFDATGTLQSAAIDAPRFDYDPDTLAARGLLIEEARTNLALRSEDFANATWIKDRSSITSNVIVAPDGTTTGDKLVEDTTASNTHICSQAFSFTSGTTYSGSFYAKSAERTFLLVGLNGGFSAAQTGGVNLTTGAVIAGIGTPTITTVNAGNGWWRVQITATADLTASGSLLIYTSQDGVWANRSYTGDGTSGIYIWGAQLEAGAFPTSYIPTTTTALTRSADVASVNTLSPWFNAAEGTLYTETTAYALKATAAQYEATIGTGSSNEIRNRFVNANIAAQIHETTAGETFAYAIAASANTLYKTALAYQTNNSQAAINGTASAVDTSVTLPTGFTAMYLGMSLGSIQQLCGHLRRVTYYPRRLSNAELVSITS